MGVKEIIFPRSLIFYDLLERLAAVVLRGADELVDLCNNYGDVQTRAHKMKDIEHEGDELTHAIYEQLNTTLVTPINPKDIYRLGSALDEVLDYIDGATRKMLYYGITETDPPIRELAKIIQLSVKELSEAILHIRLIKNPKYIEKKCIEVNRLENIADEVLGLALTDLFKTNDAVNIIKLKDIYEWLELATDKCEDAANVLSDISIRHV